MKRTMKRTPDWLIERLARGELDPQAAAALKRRLADEGRSPDDEVARLHAADRLELSEHPPAERAAEIRARLAKTAGETDGRAPGRLRSGARAAWLFPAMGGAALAAMAALVLVVRPAAMDPSGRPAGRVDDPALESTTLKGPGVAPDAGPQLLVYRNGPRGAERLTDAARVTQGQRIQLAYRTNRSVYAALISLDGSGAVTVHLPDGAQSVALKPGREVRLPASFELDAAPDFERVFLLTAVAPFAVADVVQAARSLAARGPAAARDPLPLPDRFEQRAITLTKTSSQEIRP